MVTDYKPLANHSPKRLKTFYCMAQRTRMTCRGVPGLRLSYLADILPKAPVQQQSAEELVYCVTENGLRNERRQQIRNATATDQFLTILGEIILKGWSTRNMMNSTVTPSCHASVIGPTWPLPGQGARRDKRFMWYGHELRHSITCIYKWKLVSRSLVESRLVVDDVSRRVH